MDFTNKDKEKLFKGIYEGDITPVNLPEDLYLAITNKLKKGVYKGFGGSLSSFEMGGVDFEMVESLRENIYMFSGAKVFTQTEEMSKLAQSLLLEGDEVVSFQVFKEAASQVFDKYNVDWLEAEYNTSIGQSQSARAWSDIQKQKEALPMLRYSTVEDANTSEICAALDGVIKPVEDSFWDTYSPLNHYNCRCLLEQLDDDYNETPTPDNLIEPDSVFTTNPGKTGEVFNKEHLYFDVPKEYKDLAKENFNLPIPEKDNE